MFKHRSAWSIGAIVAILASIPLVMACSNSKGESKEEDVSVPDGSPAKILAFLEKTTSVEPKGDSPDEVKAAFTTAFKKIVKGADKILAHADATDEERLEAHQYKLGALAQGTSMGVEGYSADLKKVVADIEKEKPDSDLAVFASFMSIRAHHGGSSLKESALPDIKVFIEKYPGKLHAAQLLNDLGTAAEQENKPKVAREAFELILKHFADHPNTKGIPAVLHRLDLPGNPLNLAGVTLDGKDFDLKDLTGKVVLVDFWATWCGPCLAEMPNLKRVHEKFNKEGFEIVGVPLDDDRETLDKFLQKSPLPWRQVVSKGEGETTTPHNAAVEYSIESIPRLMLIDRGGKVAYLSVRGEEIGEKVQELLAKKPVEDKSKDTPKTGG